MFVEIFYQEMSLLDVAVNEKSVRLTCPIEQTMIREGLWDQN